MAGNERRLRVRTGATIALILASSCAAHKTTAPAAPVDPCDYLCHETNMYLYLMTVNPNLAAEMLNNEIQQIEASRRHYRLCAGELDKDGFLLEVCP